MEITGREGEKERERQVRLLASEGLARKEEPRPSSLIEEERTCDENENGNEVGKQKTAVRAGGRERGDDPYAIQRGFYAMENVSIGAPYRVGPRSLPVCTQPLTPARGI